MGEHDKNCCVRRHCDCGEATGSPLDRIAELEREVARLREALERQRKFHGALRQYGVPGDVLDKATLDIDAVLKKDPNNPIEEP